MRTGVEVTNWPANPNNVPKMRNFADFTIETYCSNERAKPPNVPQKRNNTSFAFYKLTLKAAARYASAGFACVRPAWA